jgi:RNA polymerase sigma-70 factor (ECF subfamily)
MSDVELVERAKSGDVHAFDALVAIHQSRVFSLAYRMLGNAEDAADVQQETFVRAWQSLRGFRLDAAFSTWLHRIAVNLCLSRKRRRQDEPMEAYMEDALSLSVEPNGVACLERAETGVMVRKVVGGLPAHYRALIVLREIEQRPFEEVAEILGCSVASARTRLSTAKKMLRERLGPYLAEEDK